MTQIKRVMITLLVLVAVGILFTGCDGASSGGGNSGNTGTNIENTYAAGGSFAVTTTNVTGYQIFHPRDMKGGHPIITWGNGTGAPTISYNALLRHLASWGFVVIASNSTMTQSGEEMVGGIDYLIAENANRNSKFYGMLDTAHIGTTGHSQGGGGAINAATDPRVTCTVPLAPSPGQIRQVTCPTFLVAGSADTIVSASLVRSMSYAPANAPTIFGIIAGADHFEFIGDAGKSRGYLTAWFMSYLQGDQVAQQAFEEGGELSGNSNWSVERKNY